jgi:plastocyanin
MKTLRILALAMLIPGVAAIPEIPGPSVVEMTNNMTFMPREMTVVVGEVVVWKNSSDMPHTVNTSPENCKKEDAKQWVKVPAGASAFYSGELKPGAEFRVRFEIPGTYQYNCVFHEDQMMRGIIVVQGAEVK